MLITQSIPRMTTALPLSVVQRVNFQEFRFGFLLRNGLRPTCGHICLAQNGSGSPIGIELVGSDRSAMVSSV